MAPASDAVRVVRAAAIRRQPEALQRLERAGFTSGHAMHVTASKSAGRLTVNFHPDRIAQSGLTVAAGLAKTGRYLSQWRTGISSGSRSAVPGGDRQRWEHELFGDAYADANPEVTDFPIYGAWDLHRDPHGGSPRFGSCFLVLRDRVRERTTMCLGDSHAGPVDMGTFDAPWCVIAGMAERAREGDVLGTPGNAATLRQLLEGPVAAQAPRRDLDNYVETQVHGGIDLRCDVAIAVLDPSFRGTHVHEALEALASSSDMAIEWHAGSELAVDEVPDDFRGPIMPELAKSVARLDGKVDAHAIGEAARSVASSEIKPGGDDPASDAQQLKYLWHTLLRFGSDAAGSLGRRD